MRLPPIQFHYLPRPISYLDGLNLQERIHATQLARRRDGQPYPDILLLLEHRPVFTAGRRQSSEDLASDRTRLMNLGADFVQTMRGGQYTYHGPGQIVGYPLLDLGRSKPAMGIRDYICRIQTCLKKHLKEEHGLEAVASDNTGVFLANDAKIASIGVQVRHRLTTHGFAMNITREARAWFDNVVACGLTDVKAVSIQSAAPQRPVTVMGEISGLAKRFGTAFDRDIEPFNLEADEEIGNALAEVHDAAVKAGPWSTEPRL
ncbi:chloroplast lipoate protein ligase [Cylindrobasidium torrendii FP15055 ss-10]|uniref:lipoyl(octanoyl) transferase n=1 Tax=Cylindrobasidium torrendii FP15055 ss-10 TaxID=1314674 RepID=A0A0D7BBI6_9AGAR|nr:chloroplast lipoate protein ligase [Cylindrobasidium torrendii FP15055 ss-10]